MTSSPEHPTATDSVPYGTPDAPRIAVRGEAHLEVDPEIARISITVTSRGKDRRTARAEPHHERAPELPPISPPPPPGGKAPRPAPDAPPRRNATALDLLKSYGD